MSFSTEGVLSPTENEILSRRTGEQEHSAMWEGKEETTEIGRNPRAR